MIEHSLPPCSDRGLQAEPGRYRCHSARLVVPSGNVSAETCRRCPYPNGNGTRGHAAAAPEADVRNAGPTVPRPLARRRLAVIDETSEHARVVGGRQLHSLEWAEALTVLGHDVHVFFNNEATPLVAETARRFRIVWGWDRSVRPAREFRADEFDAIVSAATWIDLPAGVPVISRWIDPYVMPNANSLYPAAKIRKGQRLPWQAYDNLLDVWTQSETQLARLRDRYAPFPRECDVAVFPAPRDYAVFRAASRPWHDRDYDLCFVGREHRCKRPRFFIEFARRTGLRAVMVMPRRTTLSVPPGIDLVEGTDRRSVAEVLGNSRVFLFAPVCEVCPQTVFEALSAGCVPVTNRNGSMPEQIGRFGSLFDDDDLPAATRLVQKALRPTHSVQERINDALRFDRAAGLERIRKRLEQVRWPR